MQGLFAKAIKWLDMADVSNSGFPMKWVFEAADWTGAWIQADIKNNYINIGNVLSNHPICNWECSCFFQLICEMHFLWEWLLFCHRNQTGEPKPNWRTDVLNVNIMCISLLQLIIVSQSCEHLMCTLDGDRLFVNILFKYIVVNILH